MKGNTRLISVIVFYLLQFLHTIPVKAQLSSSENSDTVKLTIDAAEELFLKNNLNLLSQKFQIEADRAAIIQAKLFPNPNLYYENSIPTPLNGNFYDPSMHYENWFQVQQLFYLGGKRRKRAEVEKLNTKMSEYEYYNILRQLRNELYVSFYQLIYQLQALEIYDKQLISTKQIADALQDQYKKGNIPLKEVTLIKAHVFFLETNKLDLLNDIQDKVSSLRILTRTSAQSFILPVWNNARLKSYTTDNLSVQNLFTISDTARYDLKESAFAVKLEEAKLSLEKANAVPDITLGGIYDRAGSFVQRYTGVSVSMPLPLWNRNQGKIKTEKKLVDLRKTEFEEKKSEVRNEVAVAFVKASEAEKLYKTLDKSYTEDYEKLIADLTSEFKKKSVGLSEFLDASQKYIESMSQIIRVKNIYIETLEGINLATGTTVIK